MRAPRDLFGEECFGRAGVNCSLEKVSRETIKQAAEAVTSKLAEERVEVSEKDGDCGGGRTREKERERDTNGCWRWS